MSWKTSTNDKEYLYKKTGGIWKSLGPRSVETETAYRQFHAGRQQSKERVARLAQRLDELAPVNRALSIGRVPQLTARIIRALYKSGLIRYRNHSRGNPMPCLSMSALPVCISVVVFSRRKTWTS